MRVLLPLLRRKRGLSDMIAYVLLIAITISLSVIVYSWLRFYVGDQDVETCSDDVNVIIRSYECFNADASGSGGSLNLTLKNKGLFDVDGYEIRVHNRMGAEFAIYLLNDTGVEIHPGEEHVDYYDFNTMSIDLDNDGQLDDKLNTVTLVEIQPFVLEDDGSGNIRCKSRASQEINCN